MPEVDVHGNVVGTLFDKPPVARARRSDPQESHDAAKSVTDLTEKQDCVLACLTEADRPLSDVELAGLYSHNRRYHDWPEQSESGLRTRRAELVRKGLVEKTGKTRLESGRMAAVWSVKQSEETPTKGADQ